MVHLGMVMSSQMRSAVMGAAKRTWMQGTSALFSVR